MSGIAQLKLFVTFEQENNPAKTHIAAWALSEIEKLHAQLEVANAALQAAVSTAEWQAKTNHELNQLISKNEQLCEENARLKELALRQARGDEKTAFDTLPDDYETGDY